MYIQPQGDRSASQTVHVRCTVLYTLTARQKVLVGDIRKTPMIRPTQRNYLQSNASNASNAKQTTKQQVTIQRAAHTHKTQTLPRIQVQVPAKNAPKHKQPKT